MATRNKDKPDKPKVQLSEMPEDWWQLGNEDFVGLPGGHFFNLSGVRLHSTGSQEPPLLLKCSET